MAGVEPPDADALLQEVEGFVRRFVQMDDSQATAVTLWIAHTHVTCAADVTPILGITSAEKQSGKSRLLDVLELLVCRPWRAVLPSEAVVFRKIARDQPTLLLDEVDAIFGVRAAQHEGLRALLNAGHRRGSTVPRCVGPQQELRDFATFCPKAVAGIGDLPDTVADRSIRIRLRRRAPGEFIERFREREVGEEAAGVRAGLVAWGDTATSALTEARPYLPDALSDRAQDGAEPLLAIAELAGGRWSARAVQSLVALADQVVDEPSVGTRLLGDIREIFEQQSVDRLSTAALLSQLHSIEEAPWASWQEGGLDPRGLARLLRPYEVRPRSVRLETGSIPRGFMRRDFEDAWRRWLVQPATVATSPTSRATAGDVRSGADHVVAEVAVVVDNVGADSTLGSRSPIGFHQWEVPAWAHDLLHAPSDDHDRSESN